ncbi:MAG: carboxynorspermidine decarboxylase [Anaeroplasmataceae bacterium]
MVYNDELTFIRFKDKSPEELFKNLKTPCYVIDERGLIFNGEILKSIIEKTNVKILLAQKAFSNFNLYPLLSKYVSGTEASGLYEARLGYEEMPNKEVHVFCAAYRDDEFDEILKYADHIVFNSINQLKKFGPKAKKMNKSVGIRINPEFSTQDGHDIYDPCAKGSRLGVPISTWLRDMTDEALSLLDGIHFHTLCQQNSDDLEKTLYEVEKKFGKYLKEMKWINFGGGHHITRFDYDIDKLIKCINYAKDKWNLDVYLEPGEGVVLNAGFLVSRVLDTFNNEDNYFAIHDASAACHMPDVLEMPYLPPLYRANTKNSSYEYRLGAPTCLTGDVTGNYKFESSLKEGDMLVFGDMALYTTCKNNTFNGMPLPDIYILHKDDSLEKITEFGYNDFKYRLGKMNK